MKKKFTSFIFLSFLLFIFSGSTKLYSQNIPEVLPDGFVIEDAFPAANFNQPVQLVFLPDGRKLAAEQAGKVWVLDQNGEKLSTPFIDLSQLVLDAYNKGLLSIAIDPEYVINKWVYFLYTVDPDSNNEESNNEAWGRLERYQESSGNINIADLSTRQILIGRDWSDGIPYAATDGSHTIGTIRFGDDNSILISAGDGANFNAVDFGGLNPEAFETGKIDSSQDMGAFRSQSLNSLAGKILRLDKNTGEGLSTNPFWDGDPNSVRSKVWVYGLRNPFRFNIRPGSGSITNNHPGTLFIGDVGWSSLEEINITKNGSENFGWPKKEAIENTDYNSVYITWNENTNVINPGNPENPNPYTDPVYWWGRNNSSSSNPSGWLGATAVVGAFYTGSAYPSEYHNNLFAADYTAGWIYAVEVDSNDNFTGYKEFIVDAQGPVNVEADPATGNLFLVTINDNKIWRITYPSDTSNNNPVISATVEPDSGQSPLTVNFNASASSDPDGDTLSFNWDFGDGENAYTAITQHTLIGNGERIVILTVADGKGGEAVDSFSIFLEADTPDAVIISPEDSSFFNNGQALTFEAQKFNDDSILYQWDFDSVYNTDIHPSQYILSGEKIFFALTVLTDEPGVHYHWQIRLTVSQNNLADSDTIEVFPKQNLVPDSIWFSPVQLEAGKDFSANLIIKNIGEVASTSASYKILKGNNQEFTGEIPPIYSNEQIMINIPLGILDSINYEITFISDVDNKIHETNENDNSISKTVDVVVEIVELNSGVPDEYSLNQNYPNPFNPTTVISYAIPVNDKVQLTIYNILGDEIAVLVNEEKSAGYYSEIFNSDKLGLSSGVYFYVLETTSFRDVKKLILIK